MITGPVAREAICRRVMEAPEGSVVVFRDATGAAGRDLQVRFMRGEERIVRAAARHKAGALLRGPDAYGLGLCGPERE